MTTSIPLGWFYIKSRSHPHHVLTVTQSPWQPGGRIEVRPISVGKKNQLWCFDQGFFVNKQSGCVISVKSEKVRSQNLIQSRRQPHISSSSSTSTATMNQEQSLQEWQYQNGLLKLKAFPDYNLNTEQIPKMIDKEENDDNKWELVDELSVKTEKLGL